LNGVVCLFLTIGIDIEVDIGSESQRNAPIGHRKIRVELRGLPERLDGRLVIESVQIRHSLIEVALRLGVPGAGSVVNSAETRLDSSDNDERHCWQEHERLLSFLRAS
jgi:hypothetical protein